MKRRLIYISVLMLVVLGWFGLNGYSTQALHKEITVEEVSEIKLWGSKERIASNEEVKKIIGWFNNIKDIRENEKLSGCVLKLANQSFKLNPFAIASL